MPAVQSVVKVENDETQASPPRTVDQMAPSNSIVSAEPVPDNTGQNSTNDGPLEVVICQTGDVVLVCGDKQPARTTTIRVSGAVLRLGSKKFEELLKEGTAHANGATVPLRIELPVDHPRSMEVMCRVIHLQNQHPCVAGSKTAAEILSIARLSDKYQCGEALALAANDWLATGQAVKAEDRVRLLASAYHFRKMWSFREVGRAMLLYDMGPYTGNVKTKVDGACIELTKHRHWMYTRLERFAEEQTHAVEQSRSVPSNSGNLPTCMPGCTYAEVSTAWLWGQLRTIGLNSTSISGKSLNVYEKSLSNFQWKESPKAVPCQKNTGTCVAGRTVWRKNIQEAFKKMAAEIRDATKGPCLACYLKDGKLSLAGCEHYPAESGGSAA